MVVGSRGTGLLLAIALAVMALTRDPVAGLELGAVVAAASAQEGIKPKPRAAAASGTEPAGEARQAAGEATAIEECGDGDRLMREYAELYWPTAPGSAFRYLIALVPDPEESGHTDYFDAVLEGIEDAAAARSGRAQPEGAAHRYVRDRHWLPWSRVDKVKRQQRCWEKVPGVIIFRPSGSPLRHEALAVLLVGETPTWGVHARVLDAALRSADNALFTQPDGEKRAAVGPSDANGARPLRAFGPPQARADRHQILGPTFSGSAPSLRALIERHVHSRQEQGSGAASPPSVPALVHGVFDIASGTATGDDVKGTLESGLCAPETAARGCVASVRVSYGSAVPTSSTLLKAMTAFLKRAGGKSALLSEGGTAYGELQAAGDEPEELGDGATELLHRSFPPNLISLRRAYETVQSSAGAGEPLVTRAPSNGEVSPAESRGELSEQTAIAHDLALAELLRDLSQREIRNVGIVATDARDVIFIAERVGVQLSDVRLFTIGHDLRFLHPEHTKVLNGLLVAHAAPAGLGGWSSTADQNPMTRNASAAAQSLLAGRELTPLARVSLVGNGSLRQISADIDAAGGEHAVTPRPPRSFRLTYQLTFLVLAIVLLLVIGPYLALRLSRPGRFNPLSETATRSAFLRQRGAFWSWWHRIDQRDLAGDDAFATLALVSVAAGAILMMTASLLQIEPSAAHYVAIAAAGVLLMTLGRACFTRGRHAGRSAQVFGALTVALALTATSLGCSSPRETTLWLLSGGSPLIGGLLGMGMLLVVAWCWRTRLRALDLLCFGAAPGSSFHELEPPIARALGHTVGGAATPVLEHERRFLQILRSPWGAAPLIPVLLNVALLASVAAVHVLKPVLTFEGGFRHGILFGVVVACLLPTTTCFARLIVTSRALLRLLRSIATPDLLAALSRLPKELARRLESQLVGAGRHASDLTHPVQALRRLAQVDGARARRAGACAEALELQLRYEAGVQLVPASKTCPADLVDGLLDEAAALCKDRWQQPPNVRARADDYRACLVAIFVGRYVSQMRSLIPPVLVGCVLGILMTSLYFVQPRHLIATACFMWVTVIVLVIIAVYLSLARDALLSAIGGTEAGAVSLSWGLATRVGAVTVVPLAGLIASQYPEFAFWVTSMLGSVTQFVQ